MSKKEDNEDNGEPARFCMACGTPAGAAAVCEHCGAALELPDEAGLVGDRGASARRVLDEDHKRREHGH